MQEKRAMDIPHLSGNSESITRQDIIDSIDWRVNLFTNLLLLYFYQHKTQQQNIEIGNDQGLSLEDCLARSMSKISDEYGSQRLKAELVHHIHSKLSGASHSGNAGMPFGDLIAWIISDGDSRKINDILEKQHIPAINELQEVLAAISDAGHGFFKLVYGFDPRLMAALYQAEIQAREMGKDEELVDLSCEIEQLESWWAGRVNWENVSAQDLVEDVGEGLTLSEHIQALVQCNGSGRSGYSTQDPLETSWRLSATQMMLQWGFPGIFRQKQDLDKKDERRDYDGKVESVLKAYDQTPPSSTLKFKEAVKKWVASQETGDDAWRTVASLVRQRGNELGIYSFGATQNAEDDSNNLKLVSQAASSNTRFEGLWQSVDLAILARQMLAVVGFHDMGRGGIGLRLTSDKRKNAEVLQGYLWGLNNPLFAGSTESMLGFLKLGLQREDLIQYSQRQWNFDIDKDSSDIFHRLRKASWSYLRYLNSSILFEQDPEKKREQEEKESKAYLEFKDVLSNLESWEDSEKQLTAFSWGMYEQIIKLLQSSNRERANQLPLLIAGASWFWEQYGDKTWNKWFDGIIGFCQFMGYSLEQSKLALDTRGIVLEIPQFMTDAGLTVEIVQKIYATQDLSLSHLPEQWQKSIPDSALRDVGTVALQKDESKKSLPKAWYDLQTAINNFPGYVGKIHEDSMPKDLVGALATYLDVVGAKREMYGNLWNRLENYLESCGALAKEEKINMWDPRAHYLQALGPIPFSDSKAIKHLEGHIPVTFAEAMSKVVRKNYMDDPKQIPLEQFKKKSRLSNARDTLASASKKTFGFLSNVTSKISEKVTSTVDKFRNEEGELIGSKTIGGFTESVSGMKKVVGSTLENYHPLTGATKIAGEAAGKAKDTVKDTVKISASTVLQVTKGSLYKAKIYAADKMIGMGERLKGAGQQRGSVVIRGDGQIDYNFIDNERYSDDEAEMQPIQRSYQKPNDNQYGYQEETKEQNDGNGRGGGGGGISSDLSGTRMGDRSSSWRDTVQSRNKNAAKGWASTLSSERDKSWASRSSSPSGSKLNFKKS